MLSSAGLAAHILTLERHKDKDDPCTRIKCKFTKNQLWQSSSRSRAALQGPGGPGAHEGTLKGMGVWLLASQLQADFGGGQTDSYCLTICWINVVLGTGIKREKSEWRRDLKVC